VETLGSRPGFFANTCSQRPSPPAYDPPRIPRRLLTLRGLEQWDDRVGFRQRCASELCGWCSSSRSRTSRSGLPSCPSRRAGLQRRRRCDSGVRQAERDTGQRPGLTTTERECRRAGCAWRARVRAPSRSRAGAMPRDRRVLRRLPSRTARRPNDQGRPPRGRPADPRRFAMRLLRWRELTSKIGRDAQGSRQGDCVASDSDATRGGGERPVAIPWEGNQ
jgi:hypothetical protein